MLSVPQWATVNARRPARLGWPPARKPPVRFADAWRQAAAHCSSIGRKFVRRQLSRWLKRRIDRSWWRTTSLNVLHEQSASASAVVCHVTVVVYRQCATLKTADVLTTKFVGMLEFGDHRQSSRCLVRFSSRKCQATTKSLQLSATATLQLEARKPITLSVSILIILLLVYAYLIVQQWLIWIRSR